MQTLLEEFSKCFDNESNLYKNHALPYAQRIVHRIPDFPRGPDAQIGVNWLKFLYMVVQTRLNYFCHAAMLFDLLFHQRAG